MVAPSGLPHRVGFTGAWKLLVGRIPRGALLHFLPSLTDTVGRMVLEMAGSLVRGRQGERWLPGTPQAVVCNKAVAVITAEHADVDLDPAGVAGSV